MFLRFSIVILFSICFRCVGWSDEQQSLRIVSYNIENLFDWMDDPKTNDDSFTEQGDHQWTEQKFRRKLSNVAKAIVAAGEWQTPVIVGLCEVENAFVVKELLSATELAYAGYEFVHQDSPDQRGVDVALLYDSLRFQLLAQHFLRVRLDERPTRDILYAKGVLTATSDTLHLFVNHWPSRYGGEMESESKRIAAAQVLRNVTDSILAVDRDANIIIMGDFNDYPSNVSLMQTLGAQKHWEQVENKQLYNVTAQFDGNESIGSHKFEGRWGMLDNFILSGHLLSNKQGVHTTLSKVGICNEAFLLKKDKTGFAPKRAFLGTLFANGFSDHLPIYLDLVINSKKE